MNTVSYIEWQWQNVIISFIISDIQGKLEMSFFWLICHIFKKTTIF